VEDRRPRLSGQARAPVLHYTAAAIVLALILILGQKPASRVEFEDAHVIHRGGELFPDRYTVSRFLYHGGWLARAGDSSSFVIQRGSPRLQYATPVPSTIEIGGHAYHLDATGGYYVSKIVTIEKSGRIELRVLSGAVNLDRIE
jgi:hypothetical protein